MGKHFSKKYKIYNNSKFIDSDSKYAPIGVVILDTGIYRHVDFENRIIAFKDFVNGQTMPYDDNGHGTHVTYKIAQFID